MYEYKMTCMIQYPCSKHASSPSLPHQAMLVYIMLLIHSQRTILNNIDFGERGTEFLLQRVPTVSHKIVSKKKKLSTKIRKCLIKSKRAVGIA